jgi:hypothetical protein
LLTLLSATYTGHILKFESHDCILYLICGNGGHMMVPVDRCMVVFVDFFVYELCPLRKFNLCAIRIPIVSIGNQQKQRTNLSNIPLQF